ncbi:helix-turn-helix domain-containing protein [Streptomyces sioyaensis]|uniref:helix-turn-helix domain-containing protein n=1 Tax=Streptomyces sioyaensis TaxID=67364 RepID=UPI003D73F533
MARWWRSGAERSAGAEEFSGTARGKFLEGARRDLTDPARHRTPVHAIAARWGYHRATDFSRAYRVAYGIAPREHRRRAVAGRPGTALTPSPDAPATRPGA